MRAWHPTARAVGAGAWQRRWARWGGAARWFAARPPACWQPDAAAVRASNLTAFADAAAQRHGLAPFSERDLADYRRLHAWSVADPGAFWRLVWDYVGFVGDLGPTPAAVVEPCDGAWGASGNPSATWFPGARVNHAENLLAHGAADSPALIFASETRGPEEMLVMTYRDLRAKVGALAAALAADGVGPGDCCAGYVANTPDAVVAMLAATSLGAAWASCSTDFGQRGVRSPPRVSTRTTPPLRTSASIAPNVAAPHTWRHYACTLGCGCGCVCARVWWTDCYMYARAHARAHTHTQTGVVDRLGQVQPKVLFVQDGYYYRGKRYDMLLENAYIYLLSIDTYQY